MKVKSVLLVDPSLHSRDGHHFYALKKLQQEIEKLGLRQLTLVSRNAKQPVLDELNALPRFERGIYARQDWTEEEFVDHSAVFFRDLSSAVKDSRFDAEMLVLPSGDQVLMSGLARYFRKRRRAAPEVVMWLLMPPAFNRADGGFGAEQTLSEYRRAAGDLRDALGDDARLHLYCETAPLAKSYREMTGLRVGVAPGPNMIEPAGVLQQRSGRTPTILVAGNANRAKGYDLLPDALRLVHAERPDIRFVIHGTMVETDYPAAAGIFSELAQMGPNVRTMNQHLTSAEYEALLQDSDFLLLPYNPGVYASRGSGIFTEATMLGIPVIAPAGCGFAKEALAENRAIPIDDYSSRGIATAILDAAGRIDDVRSRANAHAVANRPKQAGEILRAALDGAAKRPEPSWLEKWRSWLPV